MDMGIGNELEKIELNKTNPRALENGVAGTFLSLGFRFLNGTSTLVVALTPCLTVSLELTTSLSFASAAQTVASERFASEETSLFVTTIFVAVGGGGDGGDGVESGEEEI
jgi:hypothetical protein